MYIPHAVTNTLDRLTTPSKHVSKNTSRTTSTIEENHFPPNIYPKTTTHSHL
jgi:hypothetical protein